MKSDEVHVLCHCQCPDYDPELQLQRLLSWRQSDEGYSRILVLVPTTACEALITSKIKFKIVTLERMSINSPLTFTKIPQNIFLSVLIDDVMIKL